MLGGGNNNPLNIEKLLMSAAFDEKLKKDLLFNREAVINNEEFSLKPQDRMLLSCIPQNKLEDMINKFSFQKTSRRSFLKGAAVSAALISTGLFSASCLCFEGTCTGARPEPVMQTEWVGGEGGIIDFEYTGLKVTIPEKALEEEVNISVTLDYDVPGNPENVILYGDCYRFSPEDITFLEDISIAFPVSNEKYKAAYLWQGDGKWEEIEGKNADGYLTIKTRSFGLYGVGYVEDKDSKEENKKE